MEYPEVVKARMVRKMAGPAAWSATALADETGIPQPALSRWLPEAGSVTGISKAKKSSWGTRCTAYARGAARASRLFHDLHVARGDGSYTRTLARLAKTDLPLTGAERRDFLEILEDRTERASTPITSQVPGKAWHDLIGDRLTT